MHSSRSAEIAATVADPSPVLQLIVVSAVEILQGWLSKWVPQAIEAARLLQPLWSQPDAKPPRFEDSLDRAKSRFAGIVSDLGLQTPEELNQ